MPLDWGPWERAFHEVMSEIEESGKSAGGKAAGKRALPLTSMPVPIPPVPQATEEWVAGEGEGERPWAVFHFPIGEKSDGNNNTSD